MSMYQWISWIQPTEDVRPLTFPPSAPIIGWWDTGTGGDGAATLCSLVKASDEETAMAAVLKDWPEASRWRFCVPRETTVLGDRFPLSDWMRERI